MMLPLLALGGSIAFVILVLWLMTKIHYRIGSKHLKILCLGVTLRKVDLTDIKRISKRKPSRMAEYWYSTLNPKHRLLAIQRYRGIRKFVVITPRNRYIFLADLQNAIKRVKPDENLENLVETASEETAPSIQN
jgi:hypothetical protein